MYTLYIYIYIYITTELLGPFRNLKLESGGVDTGAAARPQVGAERGVVLRELGAS